MNCKSKMLHGKNIEISPEIENRTDCDEEFSRMLSAIAKGTKT
jgi:hypothetical protein